MEIEKSWLKTYNWVLKLLDGVDLAEAGQRMGLRQIGPAELEVEFAGRVYSLRKDGIVQTAERLKWTVDDPTGGAMFDYNLRSVLGYYVLSPAAVEPAEEFCLLESFSHGVFDQQMCGIYTRFKCFRDNYERFRLACEALEMKHEGQRGSGQQWRYQLLPKLPIKIIYYEGDDEFPTDIKILWDKHAILIYKFEPLAILAGCFMSALAAVGDTVAP